MRVPICWKKQYLVNNEKPYVAFRENLRRLRAAGESLGHGRELDRYLWITGMYMRWLEERKNKPHINAELRRLFDTHLSEEIAEMIVCIGALITPRERDHHPRTGWHRQDDLRRLGWSRPTCHL